MKNCTSHSCSRIKVNFIFTAEQHIFYGANAVFFAFAVVIYVYFIFLVILGSKCFPAIKHYYYNSRAVVAGARRERELLARELKRRILWRK